MEHYQTLSPSDYSPRTFQEPADTASMTADKSEPVNTTDYSTLTLGATLRVEHYQAFRKTPPNQDKLHEKQTTAPLTTTTTHSQEARAKTDYSTWTLGATLHADQYKSLRKPPPTRDKLQEPHTTTAWQQPTKTKS